MGDFGDFDMRGMKELQKNLNKIAAEGQHAFVEQCVKELASRLLALVGKSTPVGRYPEGSCMKGGTLRRGWTSKTEAEAMAGRWTAESAATRHAKAYAKSVPIKREGDTLIVEIINPVEYASYVEYGHRKRGKKGWVIGRFMLKIAEQQMQTITPKVLEKELAKFLGRCLK